MTRGDLALYAMVVFAWGTSWIGLKLQLGVVAPEVSVLWRYLIAAAIMLAWACIAGSRLAYPLEDHVRFFLTGVCAFSMNFVLMFYAGYTVTSGLLAGVFSMTTGALLSRRLAHSFRMRFTSGPVLSSSMRKRSSRSTHIRGSPIV